MKGDVALAGFMLTAEEWQALDPVTREQLVAAAARRDDPWVVAGASGLLAEGSAPHPTEDR
jgi:hypothetical protein